MARRKRGVLRIIGWIVLSFFSLILIVTLGFYLGRGWIMKRAVNYLNDQQPGEVTMGQMNLIPLVNFPDVTLQLRNVNFYERDLHPDSLYLEPILSINEIFVRLDVIELIRGDIEVSQARIGKGFIRYEIYQDSVSNFERALGMRFGAEKEKDTTILPRIRIDLESLEMNDMLALMEDHLRNDHIRLQVNRWASSFNYLPDRIHAIVHLDIDINSLKYLTYTTDNERKLLFESEVWVDPAGKEVHVEPSSLKISGLEVETWGSYAYGSIPHIDLAFKATNEGLEVLNYLFKGVLDLEEIEQIGGGKIYLSGQVSGNMGDQLPEIRLDGTADQLGFRIKPLQKDVNNINFQFYATNGKRADMSEGWVQIKDFSATFPEGELYLDLWAADWVTPSISMQVHGDLELKGLEEMLQTTAISGLEGQLALEGSINGVIDRKNGEFLNDSSILRAELDDISVVYHRDSITRDRVERLSGWIQVQQEVIETGNLQLEYNGNSMELQGYFEQLVPFLMGYNRVLSANIIMASEEFHSASVISDTALVGTLGETWTGVHFKLGASVGADDLRMFLDHDSVPELSVSLDSFGIRLPVFAEIDDLSAKLHLGKDTLVVHSLEGTIGNSPVHFSGSLTNYQSLIGRDSGAWVQLDYRLSSDLLYASDLFTFNQRFLIPEMFESEYMKEFRLSGSVEVPSGSFETDSLGNEFRLNIYELNADYSGYPLPVSNFSTMVRRTGDQLQIDRLQGKVGSSDLKLNAMVDNFTDTVLSHLTGYLAIQSDLLDLNELLIFPLPESTPDSLRADSSDAGGPPQLYRYDYPDFEFTLDIGELRYSDYNLVDIQGKLRTSSEKIFYVDRLYSALEGGGSFDFNGQFNVLSTFGYALTSNFDVKEIDLNTLDLEMQAGEETYSLRENFRGLVSANGLAEVFLTPELSLDLPTATAVFNVKVADGELINFTPLQAAAKYLDNKDLNHVRFATLENSFPLTVADSRVIVPLTIVESTIGQMLIEGEQGLDGSYLYLLRLPAWLVRGAARSRLSAAGDDQEEDQIQEYRSGRFMNVTVWGDGANTDVKPGDRRDKYR
jgi:hypothetical protein